MSTTSLADYIASNLHAIVANCEASLVSSVGIDGAAGHCAAILQHAVCRMRARGTPEPLPPSASDRSKPQPNGINDFLQRMRAVRASVTALWLVAAGGDPDAIQELLAFNDALDLLVMQAMDQHDHRVQESQDLFIGMLSHDLRNPLHAMMISAAVIERRDDLPQAVRDVLRRITASGERIDRLARDLLEFARIRLGREMPLNLARCSLESVACGIVDEMRALYPEQRIVLSVDGNTMGEWDAERIAQALSNLIGNSIEHGRLDAPVLIDISASQETVRVTIHNQGPPIPDAVQTLFEIGTHDRKALLEYSGAWGMGLGLFIVRAIVGSHGGTMQVISDATRGTLFDIALPRTPRRGT